MTRRKPTPGHKLRTVQCWFQARCECGWTSPMHGTQGARTGALEDFYAHREACEPSASEDAR